eukprot:TRINITY_DN23512_c0_g1_i1.p1 TRINITY_DN23512_c0_g1~~TRINITY_DN23512_c0_g1_i1.p1  ORF type:complete len:188 (+),score=46.12 TRINITY_DN23512_c0_g1_i1:185-748(+)
MPWEAFPAAVLEECSTRGYQNGQQLGIKGWKELQDAVSLGGKQHRPLMLRAVKRLRSSGFTVAALTNNFRLEVSEDKSLEEARRKKQAEFQSNFNHFVESAVAGMRKPDPAFYRHALDVIGCSASDAVFLDDIGKNLKPAAEMGILTIHVQNSTAESYLSALKKLQDVVGIQLLDAGDIPLPPSSKL